MAVVAWLSIWLVSRSRPHEHSTSCCCCVRVQNDNRLRTMAKLSLYRQKRDDKESHLLEGAYIRGKLRMLENKPPPLSGPCLLLKGGGGGAYFWEDTVYN
jgi:hypothetical protein